MIKIGNPGLANKGRKLMLNFSSGLKKISHKRLSSKNAALFMLNRIIPGLGGSGKEFGKITDLKLDRRERTISFEVSRDGRVNSITIRKYRFADYEGRSYLCWRGLECLGPEREDYRRIFQDVRRIEVAKRYLFLLEVIL